MIPDHIQPVGMQVRIEDARQPHGIQQVGGGQLRAVLPVVIQDACLSGSVVGHQQMRPGRGHPGVQLRQHFGSGGRGRDHLRSDAGLRRVQRSDWGMPGRAHQLCEPARLGQSRSTQAQGYYGDLDRLWAVTPWRGRFEVDHVEDRRAELLVS